MRIATICTLSFIALAFIVNDLAAEEQPLEPVVSLVKKTIEQEHWVPDVKCVDYILMENSEPGVEVVAILEKHGGDCGGDPQAQHRIFNVYVDQKTHVMASDKDDLTGGGILKPLSPPTP